MSSYTVYEEVLDFSNSCYTCNSIQKNVRAWGSLITCFFEHTHFSLSLSHTHKVEIETVQRKHEQELLIKWLVSTVIEAVKSKQVCFCIACS